MFRLVNACYSLSHPIPPPWYSKELFEASRTKRNSFMSHFGFGKSNRKAHIKLSTNDANGSTHATMSNSPIENDSPVTEKFKRAHEAEVKQELLVDSLAARVEGFKHKVNCWL